MPRDEQGLTPKQAQFVEEYLIDLNATQAAIRAGYSEKTAGNIGQENLTKPEIQAAITAAKKKRSERTEITQDMVLKEIALLAFGNLKQVSSWTHEYGVRLKDSEDIGEEVAILKTLKQKETIRPGDKDETLIDRTIEFSIADKFRPLEKLGEHLGLWDRSGNPALEAVKIFKEVMDIGSPGDQRDDA